MSAVGNAPRHLRILAQLDDLEPRMTPEQLLVVLDVVRERRPQPPDCQDDYPHGDAMLGGVETKNNPNATSISTRPRR